MKFDCITDFVSCRVLVQFRWSCGDNGFGDLVEI